MNMTMTPRKDSPALTIGPRKWSRRPSIRRSTAASRPRSPNGLPIGKKCAEKGKAKPDLTGESHVPNHQARRLLAGPADPVGTQDPARSADPDHHPFRC